MTPSKPNETRRMKPLRADRSRTVQARRETVRRAAQRRLKKEGRS